MPSSAHLYFISRVLNSTFTVYLCDHLVRLQKIQDYLYFTDLGKDVPAHYLPRHVVHLPDVATPEVERVHHTAVGIPVPPPVHHP